MVTSHLHVITPGYPRHPKDDELVNNFMSGYAIADAMRGQLSKTGYANIDLIAEDFGWLLVVPVRNDSPECSITFSSMADAEDDVAQDPELIVAIYPQQLSKGMFFWKRDISDHVMKFSEAVFGFLKNVDGIEVKEEFSDIK